MMSPITRCPKCPATYALTTTPLTDLDACFAELRAAGWLDVARKGQGRERWAWECPACKPKPGPPAYDGPPFGFHAHEKRETIANLSTAIAEVAREKRLANTRMASKVSDRGELVIALIVPPKYDGEWSP